VDQRARWQALQSHLSTARACVDAGDRAKALEAIDAALAIDPDFLAAQSLRDCILAPPAAGEDTAPAPPAPISSAHGDSAVPTKSGRVTADRSPMATRSSKRAKRRRVDRRLSPRARRSDAGS
jgi:hypothetical protein